MQMKAQDSMTPVITVAGVTVKNGDITGKTVGVRRRKDMEAML